MFEYDQQTQLDRLISRLQQRYGMRGGRRAHRLPARRQAVVSSGVAALDALLPGGGIPRGGLTVLRGAYSSGATSLALRVLAQVQALGEVVGIADLSRSLAPTALPAAGLQLADLVLVRPPDGATAALTLLTLLARRAVGAYLIDSLARWQDYADAAHSFSLLQQRLPRVLAAGDTVLLARAAAPPLPSPAAETSDVWSHFAAVEIVVQPQAWLRRHGVIIGSRVTATVRIPHRPLQSTELDLPLLELDECDVSGPPE